MSTRAVVDGRALPHAPGVASGWRLLFRAFSLAALTVAMAILFLWCCTLVPNRTVDAFHGILFVAFNVVMFTSLWCQAPWPRSTR